MIFSRRVISLSLVVLASLASCARESSPEQQVRDTIAALELAVEARNVGDTLAFVSAEYADESGLGRDGVRDRLRGYFVLHPQIHLLVRIEEVALETDELARARVTVGMIGASGEDWSLAGDVYEFDLEFVREGDDWRVRRASWQRGLSRG